MSMWDNVKRLSIGRPGYHLTILCYHRVSQCPQGRSFHASGVGAELFREQMTYLRNCCAVLPLEEALEGIEFRTLPKRAVAITFDDGYAELAENAFPILRELAVPAKVFLIASYAGTDRPFWWEEVAARVVMVSNHALAEILRAYDLHLFRRHDGWIAELISALKYAPSETRETFMDDLQQATRYMSFPRMSLNWEEVRAAKSWGITFGSHSLTHPNLTLLSQEDLLRELQLSKEIIESMTGSSCRVLAYPNGDYNERVLNAVEEAGYRWAVTMERGANGHCDNHLTLRRYPVYPYHGKRLFHAMLQGWLDHPYELAAKVRKIDSVRRKPNVVPVGTSKQM